MTFDDIKAVVFSFQKARDDTVLESTCEAAINTAINQILRETELSAIQFDPPAINTVAGTDAYDTHASVFKILTMEITEAGNRQPLNFIPWRQWKETLFGTQARGKPEFWSYWDTKIRLSPSPDAVYSITYPSLKKVGGLDAIDDEFRDVVLNGALAFFAPQYIPVFQKGKGELYAYWEKERAGSQSLLFDADVQAHYENTRGFNVV
jgi:hypothetical protein